MLHISLLISIVAIAVVQTVHRRFGSLLAAVWCIAVGYFGLTQILHERPFILLGRKISPWVFAAVVASLFIYNLIVALRKPRSSR